MNAMDLIRPFSYFEGGAEVARYVTSGRAYVQDERYAAGAGMRRSGQALLWSPGGFASHIPVLHREVPFILNITPSALCVSHRIVASNINNTLMAEAGAGIVLPGPYEAGSRG